MSHPSKQKGARIERMFAKRIASKKGRVAMSGSATGEGDVHTDGTAFEGTHAELKARKKFAPQRYMDQAVKAAEKRNMVPMLVLREDRRDFIVCFRLKDIESGAVAVTFDTDALVWESDDG